MKLMDYLIRWFLVSHDIYTRTTHIYYIIRIQKQYIHRHTAYINNIYEIENFNIIIIVHQKKKVIT